ncbi:hypothetical protein ElyMa_003683700 [Elysia marginata]|uniref:Uncharacterized protein n=1 Tax=Elysia marginata TaxID=1093978 RepID=A0AAV4F171_9GAST|nr:hypothetical protein ElyMa_003683700 [Elysia marginata]
MPVTNTLTGTVYYRKSSLSDNLSRSVNNSHHHHSAVSGNFNSSNASSKTVMAEQSAVNSTVSQKSINQDQSSTTTAKKTVNEMHAHRPTLERSNATLQPQNNSTVVPEAKVSPKADQQQISDRQTLTTKPPTGPKEKSGQRQSVVSDRGSHPASKKRIGVLPRNGSEKSLVSSYDKKPSNKRGSVSSVSSRLEQRPLGDGAPAKPSRNPERRGKLLADCDEEGEDEIYEEDDYDEDEEDDDQDGSSDASPSG